MTSAEQSDKWHVEKHAAGSDFDIVYEPQNPADAPPRETDHAS